MGVRIASEFAGKAKGGWMLPQFRRCEVSPMLQEAKTGRFSIDDIYHLSIVPPVIKHRHTLR